MYILNYTRDVKYALRFYLEHKADMKDENIKTFCEHELMFYTNCFNNPEQFEEERRVFVEQGLIPKEEFHRILLIVYMGTFWGQAPLNFYKIINSIHRLLIVYKPDFCRKTSIKYPSSPVIDGLAGLLFCRIFGKHKIIRQIA